MARARLTLGERHETSPDDRCGEPGQQFLLQRVPEPKQTKNRMHFDIHVGDIEAEASRLVGLGAVLVQPKVLSEHGNNWVLLRDPEGNEFCVCDSGSSV